MSRRQSLGVLAAANVGPTPLCPDAPSIPRGSLVALVTPFRDGRIDEAAMRGLVERQIAAGTVGIAICGSTGEAAALSVQEHAAAIRIAVETSAQRVKVIAGCGAPSTQAAVSLAELAAAHGADGLLCAVPPYVKPKQDGIVAHIRAVAHATSLPVVLYDVPSRVGVGIADVTVGLLYERSLIAAIKDATADLSRPSRLRVLCGSGLLQFSGDDATAAGHLAMGGAGCISVTANIVPALCAAMHAAWKRHDVDTVAMVRDALAPLHQALFLESNPIPVKAALATLDLCADELRLPLTGAAAATRDTLATILTVIMRAEQRQERRHADATLR